MLYGSLAKKNLKFECLQPRGGGGGGGGPGEVRNEIYFSDFNSRVDYKKSMVNLVKTQ